MKIILEAYRANSWPALKHLLLIDFDDSFTYNIIAEFNQVSVDVSVINHKLFLNFLNLLSSPIHTNFDAVLLGPGPGHPNDYKDLFPKLSDLLKNPLLKVFGICLGHQIILNLMGLACKRSKTISHGLSERVNLSHWKDLFNVEDLEESRGLIQEVQRYNSLCINEQVSVIKKYGLGVFNQDGDLMGLKFKNGLTMQFHPESVGTNYPSLFFKLFLNSMYNYTYDNSSQDRWHLRPKNIENTFRTRH